MLLLHSSVLSVLFAVLFASATPAPASRDLLGDVINALQVGLVTHIDVAITVGTLTNNLVSIVLEVQNPLILELTVDSISVSAGVNGAAVTSFDHTFATPIVIPPLGTATSENIADVLLIDGITAFLDIIPLGVLDLLNIDVNVRVGSILGIGGIPLPITGLHQTGVATTYTLTIGNLITHIDLTITVDTVTNNLVTIDFEAQNPFNLELTLDSLLTNAGLNGAGFASLDHTFASPVVIPPLGTAQSGNIADVLLTQGLSSFLNIVPFGVLDLLGGSSDVRAGSISGVGGAPLKITDLEQAGVPTSFTLLIDSLVSQIALTITVDTVTNGLVTMGFNVQNPLNVELTLDSISVSAGLNGISLVAFDHTFTSPLVVPPLGTVNSGNIADVPLVQTLSALLAIVSTGILDLLNVGSEVRAGSVSGVGGAPFKISGLEQAGVPTIFTLPSPNS
ncbi:hypothetical protein R3P38DRAFT_2850878 [Favolaschia claudopus]|uniref:Uncharacterized protein n=1 Tax=Favolaschia claudopus TaxID=2862362 RepID=A0AAW0DL33_9AGAR